MKVILYVLVILCCIEIVYCSECSSYTVLNAPGRSQKISGSGLCDRSLAKGWYRFMGDAGTAIATSCVPSYRCGTDATGWMQGSHPTQAEGIVTRRVCYHFWYNCCVYSNNIRVRNCGGFYVYELVKPPSCYLGYCGNGEKGFNTNVTCGDTYMQINLKNSYFSDFDWRLLHLKDQSCKATRTKHTTSLRAPLTGCGTTYRENNNTLVFWNEVGNGLYRNNVTNSLNISREKHLAIQFYCEYKRSRLVSTSFSPSQKTVTASEGSYGNFTFTMDLYQSSSYSNPYSSLAYPVIVYPNQPLWAQYEVKNANADLVVFAENCRATTSTNPDSFPQHVFLERGCVRDSTMVYRYNPYSNVQRFSIKSFRFVYSNTFLVYLHCELLVCHRNSTNSRCAQGCISGSRGRRETTDMDGSNAYDLSVGPFSKPNEETKSGKRAGEESSKGNLPLIGGLAAVGGVFLLLTILLSVKLLRNRRVPAHVTRPPATTGDVTVNSYEQQGVEQDEQVKSNA